jgi:WD40 repeat protein
MVRDVAEQPGALALLSFTASKLWELRDRHFRHLSRRAYQSLGGVGGALAQHAESILAQMAPGERSLVREAFRHLVTADRTRAVLSRREMQQVLGGGQSAETVLERLIGARLLTASEGDGNQDRIEVIHEALLTSWPRLVEWQQEDAENARMRHQLRAAARQWDERGRGKGLLWRKEALIEYRLWRSRYPGRLTETEEAFARASVADEARGRRARRGAVVLAFATLVVGLAVLFRANRIAEDNARIAKSRLATSYEEQGRQLLLAGDPLRGIVYLDKAVGEGGTNPALRYLIGRATRALDAEVASLRHTNQVREAHFSRDGKKVVTASFDQTAKLWDATTGTLVATMKHETRVFSARFNADGTRIVTAGAAGAVKIWDGSTGALVGSIDAGPPSSVFLAPRFAEALADFSSDGRLIGTASGNVAKIWDAQRLELLATLEAHSKPILALAFHPGGRYLFTSAMDGTVKKWDARGRLLFSFDAYLGEDDQHIPVTALSVSRDGKRIATVNWEGIGQVRDAQTGELISTLRDSEVLLYAVKLSPDGKSVATAGDARVARIWNADSGQLLRSLEGHTSALRSVAFSTDGSALLTASSDGTAKVWSMSDDVARMSLVGHLDNVSTAEFSPDGAHLLTASSDGTARLWDNRQSFRVLSVTDSDGFSSAAWSSDEHRILTVTNDGKIRQRDTLNGRVLVEVDTGERDVGRSAASVDETRILLATIQNTRLLDFPSGNSIAILPGHTDRPAVRFSPDGQALATGGADHTIRLWNARDGRLLKTFEGHSGEVRVIAFDADGERIASGGEDKKVYVWDVLNGTRLLEISDFKSALHDIAFSRDGTKIATASRDKRLMIWSSSDGQPLIAIHEAKVSNINQVQFNPNGDLLLTSDVAGMVAVWDAGSGRMLSSDLHQVGVVSSATFSLDGRRALSLNDRVLVIWALDSDRRTPDAISSLLRCRVPFRLEAEKLVDRVIDRSICDR